jgi:uncharacterized membrane protein
MSKNTLFNARTLIAATAAVAIGGAATALAQGAPNFEAEKCFGVAKAGSNDCAATGNNSCAGTSVLEGDPGAWIYVPTGVCAKIVNGRAEEA